jgi:hypothetical protein
MKTKLHSLFIGLALLAGVHQAAAQTYALGTVASLQDPTAGADSVVLAVTPATQAWTATANDSWLHLSAANQSGTGSTNIVFTYDANPGATRVGTLTVAARPSPSARPVPPTSPRTRSPRWSPQG